MKSFEYAAPASIEEASELLRLDGAAPLAGGTQLLLTFKWLPPPRLLVNIKRVPGLRDISLDGNEIRIGALTTLADVRRSRLLAERFPVLGVVSRLMAVPSVATMATVGGNIAWASPQADFVQPLLALDAQLDVSGGRSLLLREFFTGQGRTALRPGELITAVRLRSSGAKAVYLRHSTRRLADAQICSVALTERRAVLGSCGPVPVVVELPSGLGVDDMVELICSSASPRDDFRASGAYRMKIVRVLVRRGLDYLHAA